MNNTEIIMLINSFVDFILKKNNNKLNNKLINKFFL